MGADRIQAGPFNSQGTNPNDQQALVQDTQNNTLSVSGNSRRLALLRASLAVLPAQTALTAITTAQNLLTAALNAGALNVIGRRLRIKASILYSTTSTNVATLTFALKLGSVTLCTITTGATNTAASTNLPVQVQFEITTASLGTSGTIESHGKVDANIGTAAGGAIASYLDTNTAVSSAVNLVSTETLALTIAASAAVPSAQLRDAIIEWVA